MKNELEQLDAQMADLLEKKKKLTLLQGVGVSENQDGNVGAADALTGEVDYEKLEKIAHKKMLISKMKSMG